MTAPSKVLATIPGERVMAHQPAPPERLPLFPMLALAEPYPIDALGSLLATAARGIASKVQVPTAIAGQSVLAASSLAAQIHADVMLPFGQTRPLSLYIVTIAASGDRKSSADNEALWPIRKHEQALKDAYDREIVVWSAASAAWKAERRRIENEKAIGLEARKRQLIDLGPEPRPPLHPMLTAPEPTVEGLVKAWVSAPASLGVFTAEGGLFVGGHGMAAENRLRTAATYSQLWDGQSVTRVRAGDGVSILRGRRLAIHIMVQPDAAAGLLADPVLRDQGLLSRLLVSAPDSLAGTRLFRTVSPEDDAAIKAYGARLLTILERPWPLAPGSVNELQPRTLSMTGDAVEAWCAFHDHVERQCGRHGNLENLRDFSGKAAEHAARIAGILTIIDDVNAAQVDEVAMKNAVVLVDWYLNEALRLQCGSISAKLARAQRLLDWVIAKATADGTDIIPFREILRTGPNATRKKADAEEALAVLADHGWVEYERGRGPRAVRLLGGAP